MVVKIKKLKTKNTLSYKKKNKFQNYKNCLEVTQLENKRNNLEKNKIDLDSLKKYHKEFIKNNKLILKTQQRFKSERHNIFTNKINKNNLSSNNDKRMQPIDLIGTYAYGTSKDPVSEEEIKCNNILKRYKND